MFPLWEGFDEFAHFGVIRAIAFKGLVLVPRDQPGPRDVEESLRLAPVPWEVRTWGVFRSSLTQEAFWRLEPEERRQREARLCSMPQIWARQDSTHGISAYESLQPPLYYWLMAPLVWVLKGSGLVAQVLVLRWVGVFIASGAVLFTFAICRTITHCESLALGSAAVVAIMPQFAINAARISNEPLSILLFSVLIWLGLMMTDQTADTRKAALLGLVLGLGLLTKAYFLTAIPAIVLLLLFTRGKSWLPLATSTLLVLTIAGWWYVRNVVTTGALSGLAEPIMLKDKGTMAILSAIPAVPWLRAIDVILTSHLYYCGWSSLTVRSWIYHVFFAIMILAALGLFAQLRRRAILWLVGVYGFFWLGQIYNVVLQYLTKGLAGSMGWYLYAVVACEVVLCSLAFGRFQIFITALGAVLFGTLDLYGMHWLAIPYYTGLISHRANGSIGALHFREFHAIGFGAVFERLAVNKCMVLTPPVLTVLWALYFASTLLIVASALSLMLTRRRNPA